MVSILVNRIQIVLIAILIPLGLIYMYFNLEDFSFKDLLTPDVPLVHINDIAFHVEIADTPETRSRGLSGRSELGEAEGMLFVFPEAAQHSIWMKDMNFAIDIIWIDENYEIIEIQRNITPDTWPQKFRPSRPAKYAIETHVNFSATFGFREGMQAKLPLKYIE